jgi:hypothetical protein
MLYVPKGGQHERERGGGKRAIELFNVNTLPSGLNILNKNVYVGTSFEVLTAVIMNCCFQGRSSLISFMSNVKLDGLAIGKRPSKGHSFSHPNILRCINKFIHHKNQT